MRNLPGESHRRGALRIPHLRPRTAALLLLSGVVFVSLAAGAGEPAKPRDPSGERPSATERTSTTNRASKKKSGPAAGAAQPAGTKAAAAKAVTTKTSGTKAAATKPPATGPAGPAAAAERATAAAGGIQRLSFPVKGMVCMLCTRGVEEAIKRLPGVGAVTADLATGRVEVTALERHSLDLQQVRDRAARAGFPVSGETDVEARGRFEIGAARRLTFRPTGSGHAWQVLESARLLALTRAHPSLRGDFVLGFRLHEKPPWKRPAISITSFESAAPVQRAAGGP